MDFENCKYIDKNRNELNCQISRTQLEQKMYILGERPVVYIVNQEKGFIEQNLVGEIKVENGDIQKEDIYVGITHLIYNTTSTVVFYETNVTNLPFIKTSYYEFELTDPISVEYQCGLISGEKGLILGCFPGYKSEGTYYLGNISKEIKLNDISIKYNFLIQPVFNNENFYYNNIRDHIYTASPETLDFTSKDYFYMVFGVKNPEKLRNVTLNPDSTNLDCVVIGRENAACLVHKNHFDGKANGYYYIHNLNYKNEITISYLVPPIKVILTKESPSPTPSPDNSNSFGTIGKPLILFLVLNLFLF